MEVSGHAQVPAALPSEMGPQYPLTKRIGQPARFCLMIFRKETPLANSGNRNVFCQSQIPYPSPCIDCTIPDAFSFAERNK